IGHAIESFSLAHDSDPLLHGEAIAAGMIAEAYLSHHLCGLPMESVHEIATVFRSVFPDYTLKKEMYDEIMGYMLNDKKNSAGKIGFALLSAIGTCRYDVYATKEQIVESLDQYRLLTENGKR